MISRWPLLLAAVLLIPGVLLGVWGVLTFGGSIERMIRDEVRRGEEAGAALESRFATGLHGVPVGVEPTWREDTEVLTSAMRIGVELAAHPIEALPYLERVTSPLPPRVLLAKARAYLALGRQADARSLLAQTVPDDVAIDGVPVVLSVALLAAKAGEATAVWKRVLAGEIFVPPVLAPRVVDILAECAPAPDAPAVEDLLWLARARQALSLGIVQRSGDLVPMPHGGLLITERDELVSPRIVEAAMHAAGDEVESRFGCLVVEADTSRALARIRLAGVGRAIIAAGPRGSERLQFAATCCLVLALIAFLAGNLVLFLVARKSAALSRLRTEFIDVVSHELRTPLTALSVKAEMLARGDVPAHKTADYQRMLYTDVDRLSALVRDVLDFARLERGRYPLRLRKTPVRRVVAQALRASRDAVRLGGQKLLLDVPRQLPELFVDVEVIVRALRNLIDNATRHAPADSAIELQVVGGPAHVVFAVRDAGPGLGGSDPQALFAPFRKGAGDGSGLGLAIVDRAVRAHGGRVEARDRAAGGAEFRIELPQEEAR